MNEEAETLQDINGAEWELRAGLQITNKHNYRKTNITGTWISDTGTTFYVCKLDGTYSQDYFTAYDLQRHWVVSGFSHSDDPETALLMGEEE